MRPTDSPRLLPSALTIMACLLPFGGMYSTYFFIVLGLTWLKTRYNELRLEWTQKKQFILILSGYYFINIFGLVNSENMSIAVDRLGNRLTYLLIPLIILTSGVSRDAVRTIFKWFCYSSAVAGTILIAVAAYRANTDGIVSFREISYVSLASPLEMHPTISTFMYALGALWLIDDLLQRKRTLPHAATITLLAFFLLMIFLMQSRGPQLGFILSLAALFLLRGSIRTKLAATAFIIAGMFGAFLVYEAHKTETAVNPMLRMASPVFELKQNYMTPDSLLNTPASSTINHLRCWHCAIESVQNGRWIIGNGSGDERGVLTPCYEKYGWLEMATEKLYAHNEYLSALVRTGILEVICLLCWIVFPAIYGVRTQHYLLTSLTLFWSVVMIFTSMTYNYAIQIFCISISLLLLDAVLKKNELSNQLQQPVQKSNKMN